MLYREFPPRSESHAFLRCLWTLQTDERAIQRIVPDGRSELIVNLGVPFESLRDGEWRQQPRSFLTGQLTGPLLVRPSGPARIVAARFHPAGVARVFEFPLDRVVDDIQAVDIDAATVEELETALLDRLRPADPIVEEAIRRLMDGESDLSALSISPRQLERRFKARVGITPKLFSRIQRFQRVFHEMESGGNWVEAALACGYYDQAHLVRDMRQFSGETPSALLKGDELARHFLSDFSKTPESRLP